MTKKNVLITGASSGIGEALAREYAAQGYRVGLAARRKDRLNALCAEIIKGGGEALAFECDVTQRKNLDDAIGQVCRQWGSLDVVVANAGFGVAGHFEALTEEDYRSQFETNVFGVLKTAYAALPELKKSRGALVLLGSVASYLSLPGSSAYSMSKGAVRLLADALRLEWLHEGVSVTLISPGFIESEIRRVDNSGKLHETTQDPLPSWLPMKANVAARQIVRAQIKRKPEAILTLHGKVIVFLVRHFPTLLNFVVQRVGVRGRRQP